MALKVEYWVVRVILTRRKDGKRIPLSYERHVADKDDDTPDIKSAKQAVRAKIVSDEWCILPSDGTIAEPVEHFATQPPADKLAAELAARHPGEEFRVCINADV